MTEDAPLVRMDIGGAVRRMRAGQRVAREGWNGKGMWIALAPGSPGKLPFTYMKTVTGDTVPWLCSQTDLLATDWIVVE